MAGIASGAISGAEAGSAFGPWGTAIGAVVGGVGGALAGGKKKAPDSVPFTPVNLQEQQKNSISGNLNALPDLDALLAQSNAFQQKQASQLTESALPGYAQFSKNLLGTATNLAKNPYEVPQSAVDQLSQYAAENNIAGGTGAASGFSKSNLLRSLGVNELQYGQANLATAMSALSVLTGTAPRVSPMSPLSFLVTPQAQAQNQLITNTNGQAIGQANANATTAAQNYNSQNLWDNFTSALGSSQGLMQQLAAMSKTSDGNVTTPSQASLAAYGRA